VANGRIHFLTLDHAMIPSPRFVEVMEALAKLIHPDVSLEE
jgi:ABC-type Fe3+-hydroxamate transport system substrate-binding protein